jgi:RNA polymerase sigma-70 factor, ECF subfamily
MSGQPVVGAFTVEAASTDRTERLGALFSAHGDRLYRLARRLTSTADDARDLVQETFLRVAAATKSVPFGASNEEAWLVRVLVNIRRDLWRKSAIGHRLAEAIVIAHPLSHSSDCESELIARTTIWRALDQLSPRRRAVVIMYELEGLTIPAIASLLGITAITTRWHLSHAEPKKCRERRVITSGNWSQS